MRSRKSLTGRQQAFSQFYALLGNATNAAKLAGYKDGAGIRVTASCLLRDLNISLQVARYRETAFAGLRQQITEHIQQRLTAGLIRNSSYRQGAKVLKLAQKVGLFEYHNTVTEEIANLEVRFGVSFRTILAALAEVDADPDIPEMCRAFQEAKNLS